MQCGNRIKIYLVISQKIYEIQQKFQDGRNL